jgi:MipA family protein
MKAENWLCHALMVLVAILVSVGLETKVLAQDVDVAAVDTVGGKENVVGLGLGFAPDYEGSDDMKAVPLVHARLNFANGMNLGLFGNTLRLNMAPEQNFNFGPMLRYRGERDKVENNRVDRMKSVDAALEVGAFLNYTFDNWFFLAAVAADVADAHDGYVVDIGAGYRQPIDNQTVVTFFAKTSYASENYMETYFGVDGSDAARSGLKVYDADAELKDVALGGLLQYKINDRWGILGLLQYTKLLGDAADSPLVDDVGSDNQVVIGLMGNYRF